MGCPRWFRSCAIAPVPYASRHPDDTLARVPDGGSHPPPPSRSSVASWTVSGSPMKTSGFAASAASTSSHQLPASVHWLVPVNLQSVLTGGPFAPTPFT